MKQPFAYVLYIEETHDENPTRLVWLYQTLDEAEAALRAYAATIYVRLSDDEIIESLAAEDVRARVFVCTRELEPFARTAKAA